MLKALPLIFLTILCACSRSQGCNDTTLNDSTQHTTSSQELESASATLVFVGDAMQHQDQIDTAKKLGGNHYDYSDCLTLISPTITDADYAVVNLELALGGGKGGYTGYPCFSAPDSWASTLKDVGFDLFLTANNHTLDRSDYGLRRTIHVLDSLKVDHIGTYYDSIKQKELTPFIRNINGIDIAFLNYTYGTNGLTPKNGSVVSMLDKSKMKKDVEAAREKGAELIVALPHWGVEYVLSENASQRDMAQYLIDLGVDMIIGAHPHVIQPMKVIHSDLHNKDVLVVYSLGNFISNMKTQDTRGGALVTVEVEREKGEKAKFKSATYDTFFVIKPDGSNYKNYQVCPSWMADKIPTAQKGYWNAFNNSARSVFNAKNVNVPPAHK